ncbi:hypothetical protein HV819_04215 [Anaerococcus sp. AGMB00486]|uniref:Carbohydrate kinase FGGY N-terminal domain-containing protein n=1 Tax=Anaerococcus faecalis TaxID=2742993 RepID=A0ABX2N916_9FIRM|nr:FGGY family carbohydrate kinase [Anaerococcus faecalis]NVF11197.1 hypothetical protein [Anaerococcus faecalis]
MKNFYLLIDIGTGNSKLSIIEDDGKVVKSEKFKNHYRIDYNYNDSIYFLPNEYMKKFEGALLKLLSNFDKKISAISSSSTRQSVVLINNDNKAVIGLPNIDNRGREYISNIEYKNIYERTGKKLTEDFPAAKILGYKNVYKTEYNDIYSFTSVSEWIAFEFTGKLTIEPSQATDTQLYDLNDLDYSYDIAKIFELESLSPPKKVNSGFSLGKIKREWVKKFSQLSDAIFIVGGADTQVAMKIYPNQYNSLYVISGTTTPIISFSKNLPNMDSKETWINSFLKGDGYISELNPGITGLNYQNFKDIYFESLTYEEIEKLCDNIKDIKVIANLTSTSRIRSLKKKSGSFILKTPLDSKIEDIDFALAILADIACSIYINLIEMEKINKRKYINIIGMGNGFKSKLLIKMLSNLSRKSIILPKHFNDATLFGLFEICNEYFNHSNNNFNNENEEYNPSNYKLIKNYYNKWIEHNIFKK